MNAWLVVLEFDQRFYWLRAIDPRRLGGRELDPNQTIRTDIDDGRFVINPQYPAKAPIRTEVDASRIARIGETQYITTLLTTTR